MMKYAHFPVLGPILLLHALISSSDASADMGIIDKNTPYDISSATTSNGLLTVNAAPRPFHNSGLNIGIHGGLNEQVVDTYDGEVEFLEWVFTNTVGLLSFKTAWTDGHIILEGFTADPQAYVITDPGISTTPITIDPYDVVSNRVVVNHPWQDADLAEIGFSNVSASAGQTLRMYADHTGIDRPLWPQIGVNALAYADPVMQTPVYTAGTELTADPDPMTAVTGDGLVQITASPRAISPYPYDSFFGVEGGVNDYAIDNSLDTNAVPDETMAFAFDPSVGLISFKTIYSRGLVVLEGFPEDPGLYVINSGTVTNITVYPYDAVSNRASFYHPWQGNVITEFGFSNVAASAGQTITFWIFDPAEPSPQVALVELAYGTPPIPFAIIAAEPAAGGGGPEITIRWNSETGHQYAVEGITDWSSDWSAIASNIAATPPANTYAVAAGPGQRFVRVARAVPSGVLFSDDLEAGDTPTRWTSSPPSGGLEWEWGSPSNVGPANAHSGSKCYGTDLDANYGTNQEPTLKSPPINLAGVTEADLSFYYFRDMEESSGTGQQFQFDYGFVNVLRASDSSVIMANLFQIEDTRTDWEPAEVALPASAMDEEIILEFGFHADGVATAQAGWYIDNIKIEAP